MKKVLSLTVLMACLGSPPLAFDLANLERCKAIEANSPRLACFDAVTSEMGGDTAPEPEPEATDASAPTSTGAWQVIVEVDPITDDTVLTAALESDAAFGSLNKPTLILRCKAGMPELFISWGNFLGDETSVTTRIDDQEPQTTSWSPSTDQSASFAHNPHDLLRSLRTSVKFSARTTPYRSGPITGSFPVTGLDAILTIHIDACAVR